MGGSSKPKSKIDKDKEAFDRRGGHRQTVETVEYGDIGDMSGGRAIRRRREIC
jgi:hypothetical protein